MTVNVEVENKKCWVLERRHYKYRSVEIQSYFFETRYEAEQEKKRQLAQKHAPYSLRFYIRRVV